MREGCSPGSNIDGGTDDDGALVERCIGLCEGEFDSHVDGRKEDDVAGELLVIPTDGVADKKIIDGLFEEFCKVDGGKDTEGINVEGCIEKISDGQVDGRNDEEGELLAVAVDGDIDKVGLVGLLVLEGLCVGNADNEGPKLGGILSVAVSFSFCIRDSEGTKLGNMLVITVSLF